MSVSQPLVFAPLLSQSARPDTQPVYVHTPPEQLAPVENVRSQSLAEQHAVEAMHVPPHSLEPAEHEQVLLVHTPPAPQSLGPLQQPAPPLEVYVHEPFTQLAVWQLPAAGQSPAALQQPFEPGVPLEACEQAPTPPTPSTHTSLVQGLPSSQAALPPAAMQSQSRSPATQALPLQLTVSQLPKGGQSAATAQLESAARAGST